MEQLYKTEANQKRVTKQSVFVHHNSDYPLRLGAKAFAYGNDIYLGKGAETSYLHELGHVIQQQNNEVKPQKYIHNIPVNMNSD